MRRSAASTLLPDPNFGDGSWHQLGDLRGYEAALLSMREQNKPYSDAVRVDTSPGEKLRRDELIPFLNLADHLGLPDGVLFRKPAREDGVDVEYENADALVRLQITTAYPLWFDAAGKPLNGGHQQRLHMEKLTREGLLSGSGPFERRGVQIVHNEGCNSWEEIERSHKSGLLEAFRLKATHGSKATVLLVRAVGYYQAIIDVERFRAIVDAIASIAFPRLFGEVIVVDYGDGFIWRR